MSGLPVGVTVLERGWLSSNNVVIAGRDGTAVVDSGYATHAPQTEELVRRALRGRSLDLLVNTHLHSDHCGGNATIQRGFAGVTTLIPPGHAEHVRNWDVDALSFGPTGQQCDRFVFDGLLEVGSELVLGDLAWQVLGAPGHDPHSVVFFEAASRTLISADALWERGFGVVFPELEGERGFEEVAATLDMIEVLRPSLVIPGHGQPFTGVDSALASARSKLDAFVRSPQRHAQHASKVLLKFKLLELQDVAMEELLTWAERTAHFGIVHRRWFADVPLRTWVDELLSDLVRAGVAARAEDRILNL